MHRLIRSVSLRQILPGCARAQNPQNAIEGLASIAPRPATPILSHSIRRNELFHRTPLLLGQIHPSHLYPKTQSTSLFMRWLVARKCRSPHPQFFVRITEPNRLSGNRVIRVRKRKMPAVSVCRNPQYNRPVGDVESLTCHRQGQIIPVPARVTDLKLITSDGEG